MTEAMKAALTGAAVLVVEDDTDVCAVIHDQLEDQGYEVVCANSDAAAARALSAQSFTAVVLDIDLGRGVTGFDVARHARRLDPEVAVVYVTGGPPGSVAVHGVRGAVLVRKPFDRNDLLAALEEAGAGPPGSPSDTAGSPSC